MLPLVPVVVVGVAVAADTVGTAVVAMVVGHMFVVIAVHLHNQ